MQQFRYSQQPHQSYSGTAHEGVLVSSAWNVLKENKTNVADILIHVKSQISNVS